VWPHSITVGLDGKAISVGTDAPEVIASLAPWRIPDVGEPFDYCLELDPAPPGGGKPRPFPGLYHGSTALLRSRDTVRVTTALMRVLASHARPAGDGQVRIALMPVVRDGVALLAPPASIGAVPDRWLAAQGITAVYTVSSLLDARRVQVLVDPPLGSDEEPVAPVFGGWWLPPQYWEGELSPGFAVAEVMALVTDVTAANAASVLQTVAALVERAHPAFAPSTVEAVKHSLAITFERAASP
jgi:hypothetical protein